VFSQGFRLLLDTEALHVPLEHFPWFRQATIGQICNVSWSAPDHLRWPELDVDLSVESIRDPAAFPLVSKTTA